MSCSMALSIVRMKRKVSTYPYEHHRQVDCPLSCSVNVQSERFLRRRSSRECRLRARQAEGALSFLRSVGRLWHLVAIQGGETCARRECCADSVNSRLDKC